LIKLLGPLTRWGPGQNAPVSPLLSGRDLIVEVKTSEHFENYIVRFVIINFWFEGFSLLDVTSTYMLSFKSIIIINPKLIVQFLPRLG